MFPCRVALSVYAPLFLLVSLLDIKPQLRKCLETSQPAQISSPTSPPRQWQDEDEKKTIIISSGVTLKIFSSRNQGIIVILQARYAFTGQNAASLLLHCSVL